MNTFNKVLGIVLVTAIIILVGIIIYVSFIPHEQDRYTEFYILNMEGKAYDYPKQVKSGESVDLILGVVNHEKVKLSYNIKIVADGQEIKSVDLGNLPDSVKWEEIVTFTPLSKGTGKIIQFYLYSADITEPHIKNPLVLILDVH